MRTFTSFLVFFLLTFVQTDKPCFASAQEGSPFVEQSESLEPRSSTILKVVGNLNSTDPVGATHEDAYAFHGDKGALSSLQVTWTREMLTPSVWRGDFSCEGAASLSWDGECVSPYPSSSCRLTYDGNGLVVPDESQVRACQMLWESGTPQTLRVDFARLTCRAGSVPKATVGHDGCDPCTFCPCLYDTSSDGGALIGDASSQQNRDSVCVYRVTREADEFVTYAIRVENDPLLEKRQLYIDGESTLWAKARDARRVRIARLTYHVDVPEQYDMAPRRAALGAGGILSNDWRYATMRVPQSESESHFCWLRVENLCPMNPLKIDDKGVILALCRTGDYVPVARLSFTPVKMCD